MSKPKYTPAQQEAAKNLREAAKLLKRNGLLDADYNIAKINYGDRKIKSLITKYPDIIAGTAKAIKLSKNKINYYIDQGYTGVKSKNRLIVKIKPGDKLYKSGDDFRIKTTGIGGSITRIDTGIKTNDIAKWESQLRKKFKKLKSNEVISFQFFGNNSYATFVNVDLMIMYLNKYENYHPENMSKTAAENIINNIVIFKTDRDTSTRNVPFVSRAKKYTREEYQKIKRDEVAENKKTNPPRKKYYNPQVIEYKNKLRRAKSKSRSIIDPTDLLKLRERNKLAAKKYRAKK